MEFTKEDIQAFRMVGVAATELDVEEMNAAMADRSAPPARQPMENIELPWSIAALLWLAALALFLAISKYVGVA